MSRLDDGGTKANVVNLSESEPVTSIDNADNFWPAREICGIVTRLEKAVKTFFGKLFGHQGGHPERNFEGKDCSVL